MLKVADIGSSAVSRLELDVVAPVTLDIYPIDSQFGDNMEKLDYPKESFDIVHCRNALDHTKDARAAVEEMIRVCKPGGKVFIKCWLAQKDTGGKHYWNADKDGGFDNGSDRFDLKDWGFTIRAVINGGEPRYDYIEATLEKSDG